MKATQKKPPQPAFNAELPVHAGLVDVLMQIGQERAKLLESIKEALLRGDDAEALERARELTGLPRKHGGK